MSALSKNISNWGKKLQSIFLIYRKGFFEMPFVSNTPEIMVEVAGKSRFVKLFRDKNYLTVNNLFIELELNYFKLEEGLWVLYSETDYKRNIKFIPHVDADTNDNYYSLSLSSGTHNKLLQVKKQKQQFQTHNYYWSIFKPKNNIVSYNRKNSQGKYITLFFTHQWLIDHLGDLAASHQEFLEFINSKKRFAMFPEVNTDYKLLFPQVKDYFLKFRERGQMNLLGLKAVCYKVMHNFIALYPTHVIDVNTELSDKQLDIIQRVENDLLDGLTKKFESIEVIADRFKISETKLKNDFKRLYGKPIYQYFNEHQMLLAKELLLRKKTPIKELAYAFGYETPGKFTEAFKKYNGILPSEI